MKWIPYVENDDGSWSYGRVDEEGRVWEVALPEHKPLIAYLEWVEAGNTPEDFWTRDLDSPEGLEQTQVTEEEEETTEGES